jgi:uncharacterized damage-inducible protein DinB
MLKESFIELFDRDLKKLKDEISLFQDEKNLWKISGTIKNTAGNLCLHLCGNLKTFIGANLGNSGYVRNREKEFSSTNIPKDELVKNIDETIEAVNSALTSLDEKELDIIYPQDFLKKNVSTAFFLVHLIGHLNYHLGQINYLRRLID